MSQKRSCPKKLAQAISDHTDLSDYFYFMQTNLNCLFVCPWFSFVFAKLWCHKLFAKNWLRFAINKDWLYVCSKSFAHLISKQFVGLSNHGLRGTLSFRSCRGFSPSQWRRRMGWSGNSSTYTPSSFEWRSTRGPLMDWRHASFVARDSCSALTTPQCMPSSTTTTETTRRA